MQVKNVWSPVPRFANLKLYVSSRLYIFLFILTLFSPQYNRFKLSRNATAYFILALLHCVSQIILQSRALRMEHIQSVDLRNIINASNVTVKDKFAILDDSNNAVLLCHAIPGYTSDPNPCQKVFIDGYGDLASAALNASSSEICTRVLEWPAQMCVFQLLLNSFLVN